MTDGVPRVVSREGHEQKKENERRLGLYIETLESKIEKLENDKRRLENTVLELEKGLLGEKCWYEETNALATALDDFKASLENERQLKDPLHS